MDLTHANLALLRRAINTAWAQGMQWKPPVDLGFLLRDFPSDGADNAYPWLDFTPKFREWFGDRVFNDLSAQLFTVANRDFEKSEKCKATLIEDDRFGVFVGVLGMHGAAWQQLLYDLVMEVLTLNPLAFTGKAIFANDHAYGDNALDNLVADALSKTSFEAAYTNSAEWTFANDVPVSPNFTHLLHGPKNHATAFGIVDAEQISDGAGNLVDNPNYKRVQRVELPGLVGSYDDYWALVDCSGLIKPVARQIRKVPVPRTNDDADIEESGELKWMSSGRAAAAPTFPHLFYGARL
jgi:phage major head subunit gpT-like protein